MRRSLTFAAVAAIFNPFVMPVLAGDFGGAYLGVSGAAGFNAPYTPDFEAGAFIGYNIEMDGRFVAGGELDAAYNPKSLWGYDAVTGTLDARAGYLATEEVLLYGRAGAGYTTGAGGSMVWDIGAGAEVSVADNLSIRGEFERVDSFNAGMMTQYNGKVGVAFGF